MSTGGDGQDEEVKEAAALPPRRSVPSKRDSEGEVSSRKRDASSPPCLTDLVHANVLGTMITLLVGGLVYLNYVMFEDYLEVIFWAFLYAQALHSRKRALVRWFKSQHNRSSVLDGIIHSNIVFRMLHSSSLNLALFNEEPRVEKTADHDDSNPEVSSEDDDDDNEEAREDADHTSENASVEGAIDRWSTVVSNAPIWLLLALSYSAICETFPVQMFAGSNEGAAAMLLLPLTMLIIVSITSLLLVLSSVDAINLLRYLYGSAALNLESQMKNIDVDYYSNVTSSYLHTAYGYVEENYNDEQWFPIARDAYQNLQTGRPTDDILGAIHNTSSSIYGGEWWWEYVEKGADALLKLHLAGTIAQNDTSTGSMGDLAWSPSAAKATALDLHMEDFEATRRAEASSESSARESLAGVIVGTSSLASLWEYLFRISTVRYIEAYRDEIREYAGSAAQTLLEHSKGVAGFVGGLFSGFWAMISHLSASFTKILLVWYFLNLIMGSKVDFVQKMTKILLPGHNRPHRQDHASPSSLTPRGARRKGRGGSRIAQKVRLRLEAVIWMPVETACLNATLTLISFKLLGSVFLPVSSMPHSSDAVCGSSPQEQHVDTAGTSTLLASEVGRCFLLLGVHYFGYSRIHKAVLREWNRVDINGLLTDLSMGLGCGCCFWRERNRSRPITYRVIPAAAD
eukprot:jgi/Bigna1/74045/fgenesh1_pg.27_\